MIPFSPSLLDVGGSHTGIAAVHLLEVVDVNGNEYFWSDRAGTFPSIFAGENKKFLPWVLAAGPFVFNRSLAMDTGTFTVQNVSGNTLARDTETLLRGSAIEGAEFIYRYWQADAEAAWIYADGTLSFAGGTDDAARFKSKPYSNPAEEDSNVFQFSGTCQLQWAGARCGSTESTECQYSFPSCQVVERPFIVINNYETNYGETIANSPLNVINRGRRI